MPHSLRSVQASERIMPHNVYLPQVFGPPAPGGMNARAAAFAQAWLALLGTRAAIIRVDDRLVRCAQDHAEYLDSRTPEEIAARANVLHAMHRGRDWSWSNRRVLDAGYRLPSNYPPDKNFVESCARHWDTPAKVAVYLANHDTHYDHMHGIGGYAASVVYGVGVAGRDYVALAAPPEI